MTDAYCPHDIVADPGTFGLVPYFDDSEFGRQTGFKTSHPSADTVHVLLHGVGGNALSWTPLLTELVEMNGVLPDLLVPDLPGFGQSENVADHLRATVVGAYLLGLASRLGWTKIHLIGHSMGGFLALDMASRDAGPGSAEIARLSIVSGAYFGVIDVVNRPVHAALSHPDTTAVYASMRFLAALGPVGTRLMSRVADSRLADHLLARLIASPKQLRPGIRRNILTNLRPRSFRFAARNGIGYDADEQWRRISVPTCAVFGAADHLVPPADSERLRRLLPEAEIAVLPGVGHFALFERPGAVARILGII